MKNIDRFLTRQKHKITSPERLEKKRIKRQEADARKADELFGPEEERENRREVEKCTRLEMQDIALKKHKTQ